MARRPHRLSPEERKRARRVLVALVGAVVLVLVVSVVAWAPWDRSSGHDEEEHTHLVAPHGGILASLGTHEPHDHAEAVLGLGGGLTVYTLQPDAKTPRSIGRQILTAWVRAGVGAKPSRVVLVPMPRPDDPAGTTSRFTGRLAEALWGRDLSVTVDQLTVAEKRYPLEFAGVQSPTDHAGHEAEQRRLFLTARGKYGPADIEANGNTTPARKFTDRVVVHDLSPAKEGWLCPVSAARADPGITWTVSQQSYHFCCSPCVDEFVRRAREQPDRIKPPDAYWKR